MLVLRPLDLEISGRWIREVFSLAAVATWANRAGSISRWYAAHAAPHSHQPRYSSASASSWGNLPKEVGTRLNWRRVTGSCSGATARHSANPSTAVLVRVAGSNWV